MSSGWPSHFRSSSMGAALRSRRRRALPPPPHPPLNRARAGPLQPRLATNHSARHIARWGGRGADWRKRARTRAAPANKKEARLV